MNARARPRPTALAVVVLAAWIASSACANRPEADVQAAGEERAVAMTAHACVAGEIQRALIRGDLAAARAPGRWLAEHRPGAELPEGSEAHVETIQRLSAGIAAAPSLEEAAAILGLVAYACGSCHERTDGGPDLQAGTPRSSPVGLHEKMRSHAWAAERLWEGLLVRSDSAWMEAALELTTAPFTPERLPERIAEEELSALAGRLHASGLEALEIADWGERADLYGSMLVTCAECHGLAGVWEPASPPP